MSDPRIDTTPLEPSLDDALAEFRDGSPGHPGCYAIEIDTPNAGHETLARDWLECYESTPPFLPVLADSSHVIYVGAAADVRSRLEDHLAGDVRQATLPHVWGVSGIVTVWWYDSPTAAFEHEQRCADELVTQYPHAYIHCR